MKITIENFNGDVYVATSQAEDIDAVSQMIKGLLVQAGFHPTTVDDQFNTPDSWFDHDQNTVAVSDQ